MSKQIIIPTNPADVKTIFDAIKEGDNSMIRIAAEKDQIKAIIDDLAEKFPDIGKKHIRKMISVYHKQNFPVITTDSEDFAELYESVVK
jgi:hypothetical protein